MFTIFTNERLAEILHRKCRTLPDLKKIDGIGEARAGKYGELILKELLESTSDQ